MTTATKRKKQVKLPDKLSDCLAVALGDLIKCERQRSVYRIDMGTYHTPNSHCSVCLAGSVMAQSLGAKPTHKRDPYDFSLHNMARLYALDYLRGGHVINAVERTGESLPRQMPSYVTVTDYDTDHKQFKSDMRKLVKLLRTHGL